MPSLSGVIKQASRGADLYFVFRFLRLLTMDWKKTDAYKYKIIDAKGKALRKSSELETVDEKAGYTMLHRMVFKIRRLIEKVPLIGKSILLNYAAALFLLKEQDNKRIWTDENYMERELNKFLESDWEEEAEGLKEAFQGQYGKTQTNEFLTERKMTDAEIAKREEIVLKLKKQEDSFRTKYGDKWKDVIYATATKMAMGEERNMKSFTEFQLDEIKFEAGKVYHQDTNDGPLYFKAGEQQKNKRWKGLVLDIGKKKPKSGSADEKLRFWKATPDSDIPPSLKEAVQVDEGIRDFKLNDKVKFTNDDSDYFGETGKITALDGDGIRQKATVKLNKGGKIVYDVVVKLDLIKEDAKMGKQSDDQLRKIYKTASEKDQSSPANKSFTKRVAKEMKRRGIKEEVEIEESPMLQAKMALTDAGLKHKEHNGKLIVNKKDKKKVQDALNKSFAKEGKPPELTIASGSFQEEIDEDAASIKTKRERIRKQREKMGIAQKKKEDPKPEKKEKDSGIRRAAKKAGMSKSERGELYNQNEIEEEVPTNSAGGGNVAGLGVGAQGEPGLHPKKKKRKPAWEDSRILMNKFAGKDVFVVDSDMFHTCRMGKKKYHRYEKYVGTKRLGNAIREYGLKHPKRPIILQNGENGPMLFLRYGRS